MRRIAGIAAGGACLTLLLWGDSKPAVPDRAGFEGSVIPFVQKNCLACHSAKLHTADLDMETLSRADSVAAEREVWEKVSVKIRTGEMPPKGFPRPDPVAAKAVTEWISSELERAERLMKPDPGRVTARRLNRAEYNNTIRDLLGVDVQPADDFPQDDSGYGFDNIGDVLSLSPLLMEKYMRAAEKVVRTAIFGPEKFKPTLVRHQPPYREYPLTDKPLFDYDLTGLSMPNAMHVTHRFPVEGDYVIRMVPEGRRPNGSMPIEMAAWMDGKIVKTMEVDAPSDGGSIDLFGQAREFRIHVKAGEHWLAGSVPRVYEGLPASYGGPNPSTRPEPPPREIKVPANLSPEQAEQSKKRLEERRRKFKTPANRAYIHYIEISGPFDPVMGPSGESLAKVFTCGHLHGGHTDACMRKVVGDMARRAFRRPVAESDLKPYLALASDARKEGMPIEESIGVALQALLVSPDFLFRLERGAPATTATGPNAVGEPVSQFELASRISYFLWSSMPDEELLRCAEAGTLRQPDVLKTQVRRMLRDPKARALAENFGGQWLEVRRLESVTPDREKFPEFEEYLRMSMKQETELFFQSIISEDRSILDFLDANYTFVNQRLAEFYAIPGVKGPEFRRVDLTGTHRRGVLGQASVLTVSSYATRTSPVLRGKWILENLLNAPPPPPPPGVPALDEAKSGAALSLRQQMEQHRSNAACASCHARMDPLGFGLENFNGIGAWRTEDGKFPIDASGSLPDGRAFQGPEDLIALIGADRDDFAKCVTEKLLTYALGRGLEPYDRRTVRQIAGHLPAQNYRFSSLVLEIVNSLPFQKRRKEPTT